MARRIIACICLTCGIRNDHSDPDGLCQNGHDNWLEYRDVQAKNEFFDLACELTGLTPYELQKQFRNPHVKLIKIQTPSK